VEHLINPNVRGIEISGIRKFFNLVAQHRDVISLTIGQPDFPTPAHVKEAGKRAIDQDFTTYTHNAGFPELRKAAGVFLKNKYSLEYDAEKEIIATVGASQAIDITFRTILQPGTQVILPGPVYPGYEPLIKMTGAEPIYVDTRNNDFRLTADLIEPYLTQNTRAIVLPYPSNPTGVALTRDHLRDIALLLKGKDTFIVSDEIYSELTYSTTHHSIAHDLREQTIVINGLSKSHSMTGWRIGFVFAPENISKHILKVHQYNVSCTSSISQYAAYEALTNGADDAIQMRQQYYERMEYVYEHLLQMGLETVKPSGAFYIFPSIKKFGMSSFDFAIDLVKNAGVAVVPGSAFSHFGEGYIRISFAYSMETLKKGLDRMEKFIHTLTRKTGQQI
jgi:aminotransferase